MRDGEAQAVSARHVLLLGALLVMGAAAACATSDLVVGDDAPASPPAADGGEAAAPLADASPADSFVPLGPDGGDAAPDAPSCPDLSQPSPGFCGGAAYAPTYAASGCINGFECTPMTCATGGGACVALSPGSCASNHVGTPTDYSCGGGLGTMCCLP